MVLQLQSPGVVRQEVFLVSEPAWQTGVPAFIGFADRLPSDPAIAPDNPVPEAVILHHGSDLALHCHVPAYSYLSAAVTGFFENGGSRCYVVPVAARREREQALLLGLHATAALDAVDLIAMPDVMTLQVEEGGLDRDAIVRIQTAMIAHANRHRQCALLDVFPGSSVATAVAQLRRLKVGVREPLNAALYYPWLRTVYDRLVPPSGHVAGIIARTDSNAGVFKAPANAEVFGVVDLELTLDNGLQEQLHTEGVNCLRAFARRGIRVWGARSLNQEPAYRYLNTRRLLLTLQRALEQRLSTSVFEPNDPLLWARVQRESEAYLEEIRLAGGLQGATPQQAYYVLCDAHTNPPEAIARGEMHAEIGVAPNTPAEFIVIRLVRRAGTLETAGAD